MPPPYFCLLIAFDDSLQTYMHNIAQYRSPQCSEANTISNTMMF